MKEYKILLSIIFSSIWAQLIMIVGSIVFARLYSPSSFGTLAYLSGFASIIAIISGLRFDYIVFSKKDNEKSLYNVISFLLMFFFHLFFVLLIFGIDLFCDLVNSKTYWVVFFSFSSSVFYLSTQLLISIQKYSCFSKIRIFQAFLQLAMGFLFYYLNPSIGLILAYAISQLFVGLLVYYFNFKSIFQRTLEEIKKCFLVNIRNSFYNSLIILIQYSTPFAPILIGKYLYQSNDVGAFFLLSSAICAPFAIFRRSLLNLFNGEMTSPNKAKILIGKTKDKVLILFGIIFFLLLGVVIICFFAKEIVFFIFGEQWVSYSNFILPIFVFFYLDMIFQPFTTLLPLWGRQNYSMFLESIRFGLVYLLLPFLAYFLGFTYLNLLIAYFFFSTCIYILNIVKVYSYITSLVNTN